MNKLKFRIEQLAFRPRQTERAKALLHMLGVENWVQDHVVADGTVRGEPNRNEADLSFNYDMFPGELELLEYTQGPNWVDEWSHSLVSHVGMHCSEEELDQWKVLLSDLNIPIVQEVYTDSHSNPAIAGIRTYHYCIFGARDILGTDLKFIVRQGQ